jgi:hypothetical protein
VNAVGYAENSRKTSVSGILPGRRVGKKRIDAAVDIAHIADENTLDPM